MQGVRRKTTKKVGKKSSARKRPVQERSQRRYAAIVEAAASSFADFGFDATTMEGIAATAGTSIGSVYQFFPNKKAVFREVAQRAIEGSGETFAQLMAPASEGSWQALVDAACEHYYALHRRDVHMRAVVRNFELYREFEAEDAAQMETFIAVVAQLCGTWAPKLPLVRRSIIARTIVYTLGTSLLVMASEPDEVGRAMLAEMKLMLRSYVGACVAGA